jgi:hypothetical protein
MFATPPTIGLGSDIWSLAATVYTVCEAEYPFMSLQVELGELGSPPRVKLQAQISSNVDTLAEGFKRKFKDALPPCLTDSLAPCLQPLDKRPTAAKVHQELVKAQARFRSLPDDELIEARWSWRKAEDLVAMAQHIRESGVGDLIAVRVEAKALAKGQKRYIPPRIHRGLDEIR